MRNAMMQGRIRANGCLGGTLKSDLFLVACTFMLLLSVRAEGQAILLLDPNAPSVFNVQLTGDSLYVDYGSIQINSTSTSAITHSGNSHPTIDVPEVDVCAPYPPGANPLGSGFKGNFFPSQPPVADPLAGLAPPSLDGMPVYTTTTGTLNPGYYPNGINSKGNLVLNPGVYVLGGYGLQLTGGSFIASDVLIYVLPGPNSCIYFAGSAVVNISSMPLAQSPYGGIAIWQAAENTTPVQFFMTTHNSSQIDGTVYLPTSRLEVGNAVTLDVTQIISDSMQMSGACVVDVQYDGRFPPPPPPPVNAPPTVNVVSNPLTWQYAGASLAYTMSDDGLPSPPGFLTHTWSVVSGPADVSFDDGLYSHAGGTCSAHFGLPGKYVLRLTVSDSVYTVHADATIDVLGQIDLLDYCGTFLGTLGGTDTIAYGMNDLGQVVGIFRMADGNWHAFRTEPNQPIDPNTDDLGTLGGSYAEPHSINNLGQVVGFSYIPGDAAYHAFCTAPNQPINPGTDDIGSQLGAAVESEAFAINDLGQVAGYFRDGNGYGHAFRTKPNAPIDPATDDLGTPGGRGTDACGINRLGQVVGSFSTSDGKNHAYRTGPNCAINPLTDDLGTLGGDESWPAAINDSGQVVGCSKTTSDANGFCHPFCTSANQPINPATDDLAALLPANGQAYGINNLGVVVGSFEGGYGPPPIEGSVQGSISSSSSSGSYLGSYSDGYTSGYNGFVYMSGGLSISQYTQLQAINNAGQIIFNTLGDYFGASLVRINQPPRVDAGKDQTVALAGGVSLSGSISDDGSSSIGGVLWQQVSGPGTVTFAESNSPSTTATFSTTGTYVLRLAANDIDGLANWGNVTITVQQAKAGDFSGDGHVDGSDFLAWQRNYNHGTAASGAAIVDANFSDANYARMHGDADGNGKVDGQDFLSWQRDYMSEH